MADEKTMEKKNHRKLMEKKMLDEKIKRFLSKVESVSGSIAWFAEQHVDSFPQGFISSFLENFIKYKAAVEKMRTLSVSKSQVEMAIASAIAENKKKATNKPSKKDSKKKKNSKTVVKKTDFKSVQKAVLADLSKARDLSVAKCIMLRKAKLFSYAEVFSFPPMLFFSEEEIMLAEEERLRDEEERIRAEEERIRAKEESRKVKEEKLAKMEAEKRSKKKGIKEGKEGKEAGVQRGEENEKVRRSWPSHRPCQKH